MRFLVTGGAGFIGSNTVDELVRRGHRVAVLDDLSAGKPENLAAAKGKVEFLQGSVTDLDTVRNSCRAVDYVIHLAARTSVPRSVKDPIDTNLVNVEGTLNVLVAARDANVKRVVFASSSAVYGEGLESPKRENMPATPISPYGASKLIGEIYGQMFQRVYSLEFVALRYFNVFGPRQDPSSPYSGVLSLFNSAILDGTQPVVYGDGQQSRDFVYVRDVAEANLLTCEAPQASGLAINIASGNRHTLNQTLGVLETVTQRTVKAKYAPPRPGDIRESHADIALARETLGYHPSVGFEEGLRNTWDWFRAGRDAAIRK